MKTSSHAKSISHNRDRAIALLESDTFSHIFTLKMLSLYPDFCTVTVIENGFSWACLTELEAHVSPWDVAAYPDADTIAMFGGNSEPMILEMIDSARREQRRFHQSVFKVHEQTSCRYFVNSTDWRLAKTYHSFTACPDELQGNMEPDSAIREMSKPEDEMVGFYISNGYTAEEIEQYVQRGAQFFALVSEGQLAAVSAVFPNHGRIWEIGGVYTRPEFRRKGYGGRVVRAAMRFCARNNYQPRYQFLDGNENSRLLAQSVGLKHAITVEHYISKYVKTVRVSNVQGA